VAIIEECFWESHFPDTLHKATCDRQTGVSSQLTVDVNKPQSSLAGEVHSKKRKLLGYLN